MASLTVVSLALPSTSFTCQNRPLSSVSHSSLALHPRCPTGLGKCSQLPKRLVVRAAQLPSGVQAPKEEPKLPSPLFGFTTNAEIWNSRAAMIGLFSCVILEAIVNKGLLDIIGIEIGKGLDLPL